ncbi:MAG: DNA-directed RNA polymerase subunit H [Nanoarchaeota archaeon]
MLIPKHAKLSDAQKEKLLEKYSVSLKDLPRVLKTDSAIISLDAKPGDVIKITRNSPTAGEAVFYRVVVDV